MRLALICSKDDLRPQIQSVLITKDKMVATNGHVLGVVPTSYLVDEDNILHIPEEGVLVPPTFFAKMVKATSLTWEHGLTWRLGFKKGPDERISLQKNGDDVWFPAWESVIPESVEGFECDDINMNPILLATLCKSIGLAQVTMHRSRSMIKVSDYTEKSESVGYLMLMPEK